MKTQIFTVFDSAAHRYLETFNAPSVEYAIREFRRAVNTEKHQFSQFPEDYTLFHVGEFDQEEGTITGWPPRSLGVAVTFVSNPVLEEVSNA